MPDRTPAGPTDLFERELSERLRAHSLPPEIPGLERRSVRLAVDIRRRRVALAAAVLAVIVGLPLTRLGLPGTSGTPAAPATVPPVPPSSAALAHPESLRPGDPPRVDYVADSVWYRTDGTSLKLASADRGDGALSWVHSGGHLFVSRVGQYSIDGGRFRSVPQQGGTSVTNAVPGPHGAVLMEADTLHVYTPVGHWSRNDEYGAYRSKSTTPQVAKSTVWSVYEGGEDQVVVQRASLDRGARTRTFSQWHQIITADQDSDQVVLGDYPASDDPHACNVIVNGTSGETRWHSCEWSFLRLSSDGRYALGRGSQGLAVLDIARRSLVYSLGVTGDVTDESYRFTPDDTLTAVVHGSDDVDEAIASCDLHGSCWRSTPWTRDFHYVLVTG